MTSQTSRDKSKVRYGLDSPGGSSGDGRFNSTIESHHGSSPDMKVIRHSDEIPTDLSVEKSLYFIYLKEKIIILSWRKKSTF